MATIFTTQSGVFDISVRMDDRLVILQAIHRDYGLKWEGSFVRISRETERICINKNNILAVLQGTYSTCKLEPVRFRFPTYARVPDDRICGPICVHIVITRDDGEINVYGIELMPVLGCQKMICGKESESIENSMDCGRESEGIENSMGNAKDYGKGLLGYIQELEKKVKSLEAFHDDEKKRTSELEVKLGDCGLVAKVVSVMNKYFVVDYNSNGGVVGISPNREQLNEHMKIGISALMDNINSFLLHPKCKDLLLLYLDDTYCSDLPANIFLKDSLEYLNLSCNPIYVLPNELGNLKNMKRILLRECHLKELPKTFENLRQLEYLDISGNSFISVPNCVYELVKLEVLKIDNNPITFIPNDIKKLENLRELSLGGCPIVYVSDQVAGLKNLSLLHGKYVDLRVVDLFKDYHNSVGYAIDYWWPVLFVLIIIVGICNI